MMEKITGFLREYVFGLSIIVTVVGFLAFLMGVIWFWFKDALESGDLQLSYYTKIITKVGGLNAYVLVAGLIVFGIGVWYLYSYLKNRKFVLAELETNKRSELIKKHSELKDTVKHLPSKYKNMLKEKEDELRIK